VVIKAVSVVICGNFELTITLTLLLKLRKIIRMMAQYFRIFALLFFCRGILKSILQLRLFLW
jgi:hypothetical protein